MIIKAIKNLVPNAKFSISGNSTYEDIIWQDERPIPNKEEVELETQKVQAEYDAKQYQRDRADAYPDLKEQLDLLWHAIDDGKFNVKSKETDFYKKLKAVKDANPKPE